MKFSIPLSRVLEDTRLNFFHLLLNLAGC